MQLEYRAEVARISWPPTTTAPPKAIEGNASTNYQIGVGAATADFSWICAWVGEWLAVRTTDPARAGRALSALDSSPQLPVWSMWDADGHDLLRQATTSARLGIANPMETLPGALSCPAVFAQ